MADPWIKMRTTLAEDPAVVSLGTSVGQRWDLPPLSGIAVAIGLLHRTWGLFHAHAGSDGVLSGYNEAALDAMVGLPGWAEGMKRVGWLEESASGLSVPHFDRYIGSKKANQEREAERKRKQRAKRDVQGDVPPVSPALSRGTSNGTSAGPSSSLSSSSTTSPSGSGKGVRGKGADVIERALRECDVSPSVVAEVTETLRRYDRHRRDLGKRLSVGIAKTHIGRMLDWGLRAYIEALELSESKGWLDVKREWLERENSKAANGRPSADARREAKRRAEFDEPELDLSAITRTFTDREEGAA